MACMLVTGGAGFIGSNFIRMMAAHHPDWRIVNLDALTYAGSADNLEGISGDYAFVQGDITDGACVAALFDQYAFDYVVNFAAESHVDRSIAGPEVFVRTNVLGTQVLLDAALKAWRAGSHADGTPSFKPGVRFLQISTDEVYGAAADDEAFAETARLNPSSPYAASKAAADLLALSYYKTYGLPVCVTRASNTYGHNQHGEKLIPRMIGCALRGEPLPVYGDGLQVRDWLHVSDHYRAVETVLLHAPAGEIYNVGGGCEKTNIEVCRAILAVLDRPETLIAHIPDRWGHDRRYALDCRKIASELGWAPICNFSRELAETIRWYQERIGAQPV